MKRYFGTDWVRNLFGSRAKKAPRRGRSRLTVEHLEDRLAPATRIWTGAASAAWSNPGNWVGNVAPRAGDDLNFPVSATRLGTVNDFGANTPFASLTFAGSGYTLSGSQVVLSSVAPVVANLGATNNLINLNVVMASGAGTQPTISVGTDGALLTMNGQLLGGNGINLTKDGLGTLILGANNSAFVGAITVIEGNLRVRNPFALGSTAAPTTVLSTFDRPAQLQIDGSAGNLAIGEVIRLNGPGPSNTGALLNLAGNNVLTGFIALDSDATIGANGSVVNRNVVPTSLTIQGQIFDTGTGHSLTKEGFGTVVLDPLRTAQGNIYRGQTFVNGGVLAIRHSRALGNQSPLAGVNDTVVNSTPDESGTLRLEFVPNPARIDPSATATGFTVPLEMLTLNGPGFNNPNAPANRPASDLGLGIHTLPKTLGVPGSTVLGALNNSRGNNVWTQDITLWSGDGTVQFDPLFWNWGTVGIGAEANTQLTLLGNINDRNLTGNADNTAVDYSLIKTRPGRVVIVNQTSFRGRAEVLEGFLNIRDSKALGAVGTDSNGTTVFPGGTLELETDRIPDSTTVASAQHLNTDIVIDQEQLTLMGTGAGGVGATGTGALRNILGTNEIKGTVPLADQILRGDLVVGTGAAFQDRGAWIGVEPDQAPFNRFSLSQLTLSGQVVNNDVFNHDTVRAGRLYQAGDEVPADLFKTGLGELVLTASNTYTGETFIRQGWITARNDRALGGLNPAFSDRDQPGTHVAAGAGLVLLPTLAGAPLNLQENLWLSGDGISSRFAEMNHKGALNNLGGNNTVSGDIYLISTAGFPQVGIGSGIDPLDRATNPTGELTLTGQVGESPTRFLVSRATYNNLPPLDVDIPPNPNPRDAGIAEDRFLVDVGSTAGTLSIDVSFVGSSTISVFYRGAQIGTLSFTPPVPNPTNLGSNANPFRATLTVPFTAVGGDTYVEIVTNQGAAADATRRWQWDASVIPTNHSAGLVKTGYRRLNLAGQGTFSGAVTVAQGVVRAQSNTALGVALSANPTATNPGNPGTTTVVAGTALEVQGTIPVAAGGVSTGIELNENLALNGQGLAEVQRVTVSAPTAAGAFRLGYNGHFTTALPVNATAAQVQNVLNNQLFGAGSVAVTLAADVYTGANVYTIVFLRPSLQGVDLLQIAALVGNGATATTGTVINGNVQTLTNNSDDNMLRGVITLGAGLPIAVDTKPNSRLQLWGNVAGVGAITKNDTGKLILGGNNSYFGTTRVNAGILNVQSPTALGFPGATFSNGGTIVAANAQIETQGDITIAGEPIFVSGTGPTTANNTPQTWFPIGPGATNNGQTGGATASTQNVTGRVTGVVTDPRNPNLIYVTTASGGAWRSKNSGLTWEPLIDRVTSDLANYPIDDQVLFASSIAVSPTSPNVLYVGLGDPTNSVEAYYGRGVLKSTDYGDTWTLLNGPDGQFDRSVISKVVVDPTEPDIIYIAANAYGVNAIQAGPGFGIWRYRGSTDTWTNLTGAAVPAPAVPAGTTAPYFGAPERYTDLQVIDANPHLSDPWFPLFYPFPDQFYYVNPNLRIIVFALGDPAGNPKNGLYAAFLSGPTDNIVGAMNGVGNPIDNDAGWTVSNNVGGTETLAGLQNVSSWGEVQITSVRPEVQSFPATLNGTTVTPGSVQPEGRLDLHITVYATVSHPINIWRDLNQLDGKLRQSIRKTFTYNPVPTAAQWDAGASGGIPNFADGGTAAAAPQNIFGGTDTPTTNPPNIHVPGNDMGVGWYAGALAASPFERSVLFIGGLGQPFSVGPFLASANTITDPQPPRADVVSDTVFFPAGSTNGADSDIGKLANAPHVNYHSATFDSLGRLLVGTDGGIWRFTPNSNVLNAASGGTWENLNGNFLQVTEFDGLDVHPFQPFVMAGGAIGNGTSIFNGTSWTMTSGGQGGDVRIHNRNPNIIYAMSDNVLRRSVDGGRTWANIFTVTPSTVFQLDLSDPNRPVYTYGLGLPYQTNEPMPFPYMLPQTNLGSAIGAEYATPFPNSYFSSAGFPFVLDPANPSRLFVVQRNPVPTDNDINVLQVALNADQAAASGTVPTFVTISDPNVFAGGHITALGLANLEGEMRRFDGTTFTDPDFGASQQVNGPDSYDPGTIYVLMSDKLLVTKNGGNLWVDRTGDLPTSGTPGLPALGEFGDIAVDPSNRNRAYLVRHAFGGEQVWRTEDAGQSWVDISGNLPDVPVWKVVVNSRNGDLYVGNDNGVFRLSGAKNAAGQFNNWERLGVGMPLAQVKQLVFNPTTNTLTAGTFGRGAFQLILDDSAADFVASGGKSGGVRSASGSSVFTGNIFMPGDTDFRAAAGAQVNFIGQITEPNDAFFKVNKTGPGRVIFSGANNFSGTVEVKEGVLTVRNPTALGKLARIVPGKGLVGQTIVDSGAALEMQSNLLGERVELNGNGIKFNGVDTGALRNVSNFNTFTGVLVLNTNSTIGVDSGSQLTIGTGAGLPFAGTITDGTGAFGVTKQLTGRLVLNFANSFDGVLDIQQGSVLVQHALALGSTAGGTRVETAAQLQLPGNLNIVNEDLHLSGPGIFDTGALAILGTAANSWNGPVHLDGPGVAGIGVSAGNFILPRAIDGTGGLRKVGAGGLVLTTDNTYAGVTQVAGGSLEIRTAGGLGAAAAGTEVLSGATLVLNSATDLTILDEALSLFGGTLRNFRGNNTWAGDWTLQGNAVVLVDTGKQLTASGTIRDLAAPNPAGALTKRGAGQLTLTGSETYRGGTVIEQGALRVDGTIGNVVLAGGQLWGSGTVGAMTSGAGASLVAPGANTPASPTGILTSGPVTWSSSTLFFVNLNGTTPGTGHDQLVVNGNITLNGATLMGTAAPSVAVGDTFVIVRTTGSGRVIGTFAGLPQNGVVVMSGQRFRVNYTTSTVTLTRLA